ncbi:hypothetical protein FOA52_007986 [Chlamydomonas sp. UWO 241]|nr:hypothetical protein FOA52_007986 [Chlamydomonas sp. UWO 241]
MSASALSAGDTPTDSGVSKKRESVKWGQGEIALLVACIEGQGHDKINWTDVARAMPRRTGKQCREKWKNDLRPDVRKEPWTSQEEYILARLHAEVGNQWAELAKYLNGRSENSIKNHWNAMLRSKACAKGRTLLGTYGRLVYEKKTTSLETLQAAKESYSKLKGVEPLEAFVVAEEFFARRTSRQASVNSTPVKVKVGTGAGRPPAGRHGRLPTAVRRSASDFDMELEDASMLSESDGAWGHDDDSRPGKRSRRSSGGVPSAAPSRRASCGSLPPLHPSAAAMAAAAAQRAAAGFLGGYAPVHDGAAPHAFTYGTHDASAAITLKMQGSAGRHGLPKVHAAPVGVPQQQQQHVFYHGPTTGGTLATHKIYQHHCSAEYDYPAAPQHYQHTAAFAAQGGHHYHHTEFAAQDDHHSHHAEFAAQDDHHSHRADLAAAEATAECAAFHPEHHMSSAALAQLAELEATQVTASDLAVFASGMGGGAGGIGGAHDDDCGVPMPAACYGGDEVGVGGADCGSGYAIDDQAAWTDAWSDADLALLRDLGGLTEDPLGTNKGGYESGGYQHDHGHCGHHDARAGVYGCGDAGAADCAAAQHRLTVDYDNAASAYQPEQYVHPGAKVHGDAHAHQMWSVPGHHGG